LYKDIYKHLKFLQVLQEYVIQEYIISHVELDPLNFLQLRCLSGDTIIKRLIDRSNLLPSVTFFLLFSIKKWYLLQRYLALIFCSLLAALRSYIDNGRIHGKAARHAY